MATLPTYSDGNVTHASDLEFLLKPPGARVYQTTAQAALATSTWTLVTWDTLAWDNDLTSWNGITNLSRLVFNTVGRFEIIARLTWNANATGARQLSLRKNAGGAIGGGVGIDTRVDGSSGGSTVTTNLLVCEFDCNTPGDYAEVFGWQSSGGNLQFNVGGGSQQVSLLARFLSAV